MKNHRLLVFLVSGAVDSVSYPSWTELRSTENINRRGAQSFPFVSHDI